MICSSDIYCRFVTPLPLTMYDRDICYFDFTFLSLSSVLSLSFLLHSLPSLSFPSLISSLFCGEISSNFLLFSPVSFPAEKSLSVPVSPLPRFQLHFLILRRFPRRNFIYLFMHLFTHSFIFFLLSPRVLVTSLLIKRLTWGMPVTTHGSVLRTLGECA